MADSTPDYPFIFEVSDPGLNLHSVMVRMSNTLAAKYPNKPWGTRLSEIVIKKESDKFPNYVLVAFENVPNSNDLFWIFQSLAAAREWNKTTKTKEDLIPQKFKGQVTVTTVRKDVTPETLPEDLTGDQILADVEQQKDTGKAVLTTATEVIVENVTPLVGQRFAPDGVLIATSEALVVEGTDAARGLNVVEGVVDPLGNGKAIESILVPRRRKTDDTIETGWPTGQTKESLADNFIPADLKSLVSQKVTTTQVTLGAADVGNIPAPATPTGNEVSISHKKINDWRYERRVTEEEVTSLGAHDVEVDRLRPQKFYCPQGTVSLTTITLGADPGPPDTPSPDVGQSILISQRGTTLITKTVTQSGDPQALKGMDLLMDDGWIYPSTEELVSNGSVPSTNSFINSSGQAITFDTYDACNSIRKTRQAVSLNPGYQKAKDKRAPEKFLTDASTSVVVQTEAGVAGAAPEPTANLMQSQEIEQKGAIRTTKTTTQGGALIPLPATDYMPTDGKVYPSQQEAVPLSAVPAVPSTVAADGTIETYTSVDTNYAIKERKQVVSLEDGTARKASKVAPDRFFRDKSVTELVETETAVVGAPPAPSVVDYKSEQIEQKGAIRTTTTVTQNGSPTPVRGTSFDERTGESFLETEEIVSVDTVAPFGVQTDGTITLFEGQDANWSVKRIQQIVSATARSWTEIINYEWPPVLKSLTFKIWEAKNGRGSVIYPVVKYKQGFTGPQAVQVNQYWQLAQPVVIPQLTLITEGIQYRCPLYAISIPPCLHVGLVLECNIGSTDPDWESATDAEVFEATPYTDWPNTIMWRETKPYRGGYLVHEYTLSKPT